MKKMLILVAIIALSLMLTSGAALALSGVCSNCHTMHNSQNNAPMASAGGPFAKLLLGDCISCHSGFAGNLDANAPQVDYNGALAGGYFSATAANTHNVTALNGADGTLTTPPGDNNTTGINGVTPLTCAGTKGCHGDRVTAAELNSLQGAHHNNSAGTILAAAALTPGSSYRFLQGVAGIEDTDWQITNGAADHNGYFGINGPAGAGNSATAPAGNTISGFCNECHGDFHGAGASSSTQNASSEWIRHPTDRQIPVLGEYSNAFGNGGAYIIDTPVAINNLAGGITSTVTAGGDAIVMCLSCHKAHGSGYADALRWDYAGMQVGTTGATAGTGCFRCHTNKDG